MLPFLLLVSLLFCFFQICFYFFCICKNLTSYPKKQKILFWTFSSKSNEKSRTNTVYLNRKVVFIFVFCFNFCEIINLKLFFSLTILLFFCWLFPFSCCFLLQFFIQISSKWSKETKKNLYFKKEKKLLSFSIDFDCNQSLFN